MYDLACKFYLHTSNHIIFVMKSVLFLMILSAGYGFAQEPDAKKIQSHLKVVTIASKEIETVLSLKQHVEAPNWSKDGTYFVVNSNGLLYRVPRSGNVKLSLINTGFADHCNNDHGISPDGQLLAISHNKPLNGGRSSAIYTVPISGGKPVEITKDVPSYWHGWSPDGKILTYCAERNGNFDVYTIPATGGKEIRLTTDKGLDDGPEYSPDGKFIYYNSFKNGSMQLWRMKADGTEQVQLTNDAYSNWFPHPSPDGKWIVFISYMQNQGQNHPFGKDVKLRLLSLTDQSITDLTEVFFGGQGTINVPSWSADSKQVAFVTYEVVAK